ncbi:MAG TPA: MaoC family dehydratase N-terminal domain-containing protein [Pseudonocardia sp.]|jgi:acyl dehydratase|nr:MaoC family dehydratase N-terminal domain-containing protein [Pseudonocardia sp.]
MVTLDPGIIGRRLGEHAVDVERGRLRIFAGSTAQTDPVYTDVGAAGRAGHRDLPVPPTFLFCLDLEGASAATMYRDLGIDTRTILHGEQEFAYHAMAYAGDRLHFTARIADVYAKKDGALQFLVRTVDVDRDGEPIAQLRTTTVIRDTVRAS